MTVQITGEDVMGNELFSDNEYKAWVKELKARIRQSQLKASVRVNSSMLELYWGIGADIVEKQDIKGWGGKVIPQLSKDLRSEFSGVKGFSETNLKQMRRFYLFYRNLGTNLVPKLDASIGHQVGAQLQNTNTSNRNADITDTFPAILASIPWRHHEEIIRFCSTAEEALFFIQKTIENGWSRALLLNFMDTDLYERQGKAVTNFSRVLPDTQSELAQETLKDPYNFDFISLTEKHKELELEDALASNITDFLIELGQGFAYIGRQIPIAIDDTEAILDLLFYHTILRCYIVIELKTSRFKSDYIGQLGLYVSAINHLKKTEADNPTIGLLICKTKSDVVAEWSLESSSQPIGISAYELSNLLPEEVKSTLPSIEEIEATLKDKYADD
jgi:predicted nuclease of restriction endonuclease-like (RecB) superfamily